MEGGGVGSRQSRTSSRYASAPDPSPAPFNGPVRKWKKQWVPFGGGGGVDNNNGKPNTAAKPLLLCRWAPLSAAAAADEPPTRRVRYTPIDPIKNKKTPVKVSNDGGTSMGNQSSNGADVISDSDGLLEKVNTWEEEAPEVNEDQADLDEIGADGSSSDKKRKVNPVGEGKW